MTYYIGHFFLHCLTYMNLNNYHQIINSQEHQAMLKEYAQNPWAQGFHFETFGWINDPNGLCHFQGKHHWYFQYSLECKGGQKLWGHIATKDLVNFEQYEPFLFNDHERDLGGAYSGCAYVKGDEVYYYYTGNKKNVGDYDYIYAGREHNTILVTSKDTVNHTPKEPLLLNKDYPEDMSCHVRDPKVFTYEGKHYMVLGARTCSDEGIILIYRSDDLKSWEFHMRLEPQKFGLDVGFMLECPDLFNLDDQWFLITCPQGMPKTRYLANVYQVGYFPLDIDLENKTYTLYPFKSLDYGFDFYAPQTYTEQDRHILLGWFGLPDIDYFNPTTKFHSQHCLSIPRKLSAKNRTIYQEPLAEFSKLHQEQLCNNPEIFKTTEFKAESKFDLTLNFNSSVLNLQLRDTTFLKYDSQAKELVLEFTDSEASAGRTSRHLPLEKLENVRIIADTSSFEIFVNNGEFVFNTRDYHLKDQCNLKCLEADINSVTLYRLGNTTLTQIK